MLTVLHSRPTFHNFTICCVYLFSSLFVQFHPLCCRHLAQTAAPLCQGPEHRKGFWLVPSTFTGALLCAFQFLGMTLPSLSSTMFSILSCFSLFLYPITCVDCLLTFCHAASGRRFTNAAKNYACCFHFACCFLYQFCHRILRQHTLVIAWFLSFALDIFKHSSSSFLFGR